MKKANIQLLHDRAKQSFTVKVNDKEAYTPFTYQDFAVDEMEVRRTAKACAFDEVCREVINGNKVTASFLVFN